MILSTYQLWVSEAIIFRTIKDIAFTRKVNQRIAAQRNEIAQGRWYMSLEGWSPKILVFVDESAANERTLDRRYGCDIPAIDTQVLHRSTRWTILPACDHTVPCSAALGLVCYLTAYVTVTSRIFGLLK